MDPSIDRRALYDLAHLGEAIGDPRRAAILVALLGGTARPASELAEVAGVAPSTATSHLQRLLLAGLVVVRPQGRHRYYALSGPRVAGAVEALATCTRAGATAPPRDGLSLARTCYGHLAGRLAVCLWARAREERWVRWSDASVRLLAPGREALGLSGAGAALEGKPCLDWSERVPHVSGPLGVALSDALLGRRWLARAREGRGLRVTALGEARLSALGVRWDR